MLITITITTDIIKVKSTTNVFVRLETDSMLFAAGEQIPAHEFHRWDAENPGEDFLAEKPSGRSWRCAYAGETLYAGYPHFHFYANLSAAVRFVEACRKEKHRYE